jgi:hypothetical protein
VKMATLSELISRCFSPEEKDRNKGRMEALSAPLQSTSEKPAYKYEAEVFNFLLANKESLGIKEVTKFTALLVDGAVELLDGKRLVLEIKFRMNWKKACQAEYQFRNFLKRHIREAGPVNGGLVLFEEFSGDGWEKQAACRLWENGWSCWYGGHSEVDGFRLDLLRLRNGKLENSPLADANKAKVDESTSEEASRLLAGLVAEGTNQSLQREGGGI